MVTIGSLKKKGTPEHLDRVLSLRDVIPEEDYIRFWRGFNPIPERDEDARNRYTDEWLASRERGSSAPPPAPPTPPKRARRIVRKSKGWATRDAKKFGGKVIRVDKYGKPNPRGRSYKAVK